MRLIYTSESDLHFDLKDIYFLKNNSYDEKIIESNTKEITDTQINCFDYNELVESQNVSLSTTTYNQPLENIYYDQLCLNSYVLSCTNNDQNNILLEKQNMCNKSEFKENDIYTKDNDLEEQIQIFEKILVEVQNRNLTETNDKLVCNPVNLENCGNESELISINTPTIDKPCFNTINNSDVSFLQQENITNGPILTLINEYLYKSTEITNECISLINQQQTMAYQPLIEINQIQNTLTKINSLLIYQLKLQRLIYIQINKETNIKEVTANDLTLPQLNELTTSQFDNSVYNLYDHLSYENSTPSTSNYQPPCYNSQALYYNLDNTEKNHIKTNPNLIEKLEYTPENITMANNPNLKINISNKKNDGLIKSIQKTHLYSEKKEDIDLSNDELSFIDVEKLTEGIMQFKNLTAFKSGELSTNVDQTQYKNEKFFYGTLSSSETENIKDNYSDSDNTTEDEGQKYSYKCFKMEIPCSKLKNTAKNIFVHKDANYSHCLNTELDFNNLDTKYCKNYKDEVTHLPEAFSFSSGWNKFKLYLMPKLKINSDKSIFKNICRHYGLENYSLIIFNIIHANTCIQKNKYITFEICFHLVCFHLCTVLNLGKGKDVQVDKKLQYFRLINNKNYCRLFKTKQYWFNKATKLLAKTKIKAFKELNITQSSFQAIHVYNLLLLLPFKNSKSLVFIFYVYHATNTDEVDTNLNNLNRNKWEEILKKRQALSKIAHEYPKHTNNAYKNLKNRFKLFQKHCKYLKLE
ncbi:hypothetical protein NUSPORA_00405 [Nucleospora cyclopteri]